MRTLRSSILGLALALLAAGCGGGDGCAGFITINVPPAECEARAKQFGCSSFEVTGPSCGLSGCVTCEDI